MSWQVLFLVAVGGAIGAVFRAIATGILHAARIPVPWGTLFVNVLGSLFVGYLMGTTTGSAADCASAHRHALLVTGLCGGFTTFSAFSWQTFDQVNRGAIGVALANIAASFALCLLAVWVGFRLAR
ncbi:MAG: CrcB family protein [Puniceicoccales bacterium]|jgi:CrcB protein|nr:CrcB family protein [Puniceicoccales bacterium]